MKFNKKILEIIFDLDENKEVDGYKIIHSGDWISEGKYEHREIIFKWEDKYYSISDSRSGSYFTDWYYESEDWGSEVECFEVEPIEIKSTVWKPVK